jgi:hypothetical protein
MHFLKKILEACLIISDSKYQSLKGGKETREFSKNKNAIEILEPRISIFLLTQDIPLEK